MWKWRMDDRYARQPKHLGYIITSSFISSWLVPLGLNYLCWIGCIFEHEVYRLKLLLLYCTLEGYQGYDPSVQLTLAVWRTALHTMEIIETTTNTATCINIYHITGSSSAYTPWIWYLCSGIKSSSYVVEKDLGHTVVLYKHSRWDWHAYMLLWILFSLSLPSSFPFLLPLSLPLFPFLLPEVTKKIRANSIKNLPQMADTV